MNTDSQIETKTETYWDHFGMIAIASIPKKHHYPPWIKHGLAFTDEVPF